MLRILRRLALLLLALLLPLYAVSLFERQTVPEAWSRIAGGQGHDAVRALLHQSGLDDHACEWLSATQSVRCTLVGRHHASGVEVHFDGAGRDARVDRVRVHEPVYTGPFHLHVRLRRWLR